jgi:hypothetical protein
VADIPTLPSGWCRPYTLAGLPPTSMTRLTTLSVVTPGSAAIAARAECIVVEVVPTKVAAVDARNLRRDRAITEDLPSLQDDPAGLQPANRDAGGVALDQT